MAYDEFTSKMVRKCSELEQALAEKDQEIEAKDTELGKLDAELIVCNAAYRQLMKQAIRFAQQCVQPIRGKVAIQIADEAQAFLKEHKL